MRARLSPLAALAAGLLLAGCTAAGRSTGGLPVVERAVALAADVPHADLVSGLTVTPDGTALVTTVGPAGRSRLTVVDLPGDGTATAGDAVVLDDVEQDVALAAGGETLVVGRVGAPWGGHHAVLVVDPSQGAVRDSRAITGSGQARELSDTGEQEAAALPDGTVVVAADRPDGPPLLLLVDPATGAVTASVELDLSAVPGERTNLHALAVSPDGSRIAVGLAVRAGGRWTPVVSVVDAGLTGPAAPVALDGGSVTALAVADDGTAYVALEGAAGVLAVDAAAGDAREVPADLSEVTELAVVAGELVAVDRGLTVTRLDPADGAVTDAADLCTGTGAASGIGVAPDGSLVVTANCAGAGLWVLPA